MPDVVAAGRPGRLVYVVGTGTEVGKTWVSARLLETLAARGVAVGARKPAQSFGPGDDPAGTDAAVLGRATGEPPELVCPPDRWYPVAMAPPMAAAALGRPVPTLADLVAGVRWPDPPPAVGLVESAGGVRSPQADDGDAVDLGRLLAPDLVVLVADAALGVINAVRLCAEALDPVAGPGRARLAVVLNRFDPADDVHRRSAAWLAERCGLAPVLAPGGLAALADRVVVPGPPRP